MNQVSFVLSRDMCRSIYVYPLCGCILAFHTVMDQKYYTTCIIPVYTFIAHSRMMANSEQFGQRRPPLSVTIKGILERYPDGQIFKVHA